MTLLNVLAMTVAEIFGNANLKHFTGNAGRPGHLVGGCVGYACVMYFLIQSYATTSMLVTTFLWEGMIAVLGSAYALFVLGERFTSGIQYAGVALMVLAMWMIHQGNRK